MTEPQINEQRRDREWLRRRVQFWRVAAHQAGAPECDPRDDRYALDDEDPSPAPRCDTCRWWSLGGMDLDKPLDGEWSSCEKVDRDSHIKTDSGCSEVWMHQSFGCVQWEQKE